MQCLNDLDTAGNKINNRIFGADDGRDHRRQDIVFSPCQEGETPDCVNKISDSDSVKKTKLADMLAYLG